MKSTKATEEARKAYDERNLAVCRAVGVRAGLGAALARLRLQKRPPLWLVELLDREVGKLPSITVELAEHRDELYDAAWKDAF